MVEIAYSVTVQVSGGPKISASDKIGVEAYDVIQVELPKNGDSAQKVDVEIQPASQDNQVRFLLIRQLSPDSYKQVEYVFGTDTQERDLDAPLFLFGRGAVSLLGTTPPTTLSFKNQSDAEVEIQIVVGRDATPPYDPPNSDTT